MTLNRYSCVTHGMQTKAAKVLEKAIEDAAVLGAATEEDDQSDAV
jgi:hypothetical protein